MTEPFDGRQLALFGAVLLGADAALKAEGRYVQDVRRNVLRTFDQGIHRTRRRMRSTTTALEFALVGLVVLVTVAGQIRERHPSSGAD